MSAFARSQPVTSVDDSVCRRRIFVDSCGRLDRADSNSCRRRTDQNADTVDRPRLLRRTSGASPWMSPSTTTQGPRSP